MDDREVLDSIRNLISRTHDTTELLSGVVTLLHRARHHYDWVGVYLLNGEELTLGPYVGKPTSHTRIPLNQGICGAAASTGQTLIVDDVRADPRYLACSLETRSEIVVPIRHQGRILGEIDIDSDQPAAFTLRDRDLLETVAALLAKGLPLLQSDSLMTEQKPILVVAGIIRNGDRILICQRQRADAYGLQWEFPGGKVKGGETLPIALRRELEEELAIQANVGEEVFRLRHHYPDRYVEVVFFAVANFGGEVRNQVFETMEWAPRAKLPQYNFLEADRELVNRISRGEIV
jgi:mutator protein MutT